MVDEVVAVQLSVPDRVWPLLMFWVMVGVVEEGAGAGGGIGIGVGGVTGGGGVTVIVASTPLLP